MLGGAYLWCTYMILDRKSNVQDQCLPRSNDAQHVTVNRMDEIRNTSLYPKTRIADIGKWTAKLKWGRALDTCVACGHGDGLTQPAMTRKTKKNDDGMTWMNTQRKNLGLILCRI